MKTRNPTWCVVWEYRVRTDSSQRKHIAQINVIARDRMNAEKLSIPVFNRLFPADLYCRSQKPFAVRNLGIGVERTSSLRALERSNQPTLW